MCTKIKMISYDTHNNRRRRPCMGTSISTTLLLLILATCHIHSTVSAVTLPGGSDIDMKNNDNEDTSLLLNFGGRRNRLLEHRNRRQENTGRLLHNDSMNDIKDREGEGGVEDNLQYDILDNVGGEDKSTFIPRILKKKKQENNNQNNKKVRTTNKKKIADSINKETGAIKRKKADQRKRAKDTSPKKKDIVEKINKFYPGRASSSPLMDLFLTYLQCGEINFKSLLQERKANYTYLKE